MEHQEDRSEGPSACRPGPPGAGPHRYILPPEPGCEPGWKQQCLLGVTPGWLTSDAAVTEVATLLGGS